jgi:sugar phosphate isomerase/epimerase
MFLTLSAGALPLNASFDQTIQIAAATGFVAVDLPMNEFFAGGAQPDSETIAAHLASARLEAGGWFLPVQFRESEAAYRAGRELLPRAASLAQALHSPWCATFIWPCSDDLDYRSNMTLHLDRLGPVAAELAEFGIKLGLEFVGPQSVRAGHKYEFISTLRQTLDLIDKLGYDNVGVLLDSWHWYASRGTVAELDALDGHRIVYVHINDAPLGRDVSAQIDDERMLPGATGVIDITAFLKSLQRRGFDGPVCVEPYNADVRKLLPEERARVARDSALRVFKDAGVPIR